LAHPPVAVLVLVCATALECASPFADLPRSDAVRLTDFVSIPTPLWHICQLLFWFLSVQLRTDVQRLCADLPRSDAVRLAEFIAFLTPLWHIYQLMFWFLSVQLHSDLQPLIQLCAALISVWPSEFLNFPTQCRSFGQMLL